MARPQKLRKELLDEVHPFRICILALAPLAQLLAVAVILIAAALLASAYMK